MRRGSRTAPAARRRERGPYRIDAGIVAGLATAFVLLPDGPRADLCGLVAVSLAATSAWTGWRERRTALPCPANDRRRHGMHTTPERER